MSATQTTQTPKSRRSKRSQYDIIHSILNTLREPRKKTHVMYNANLSYDLTRDYLNKLQDKGLVTYSDGLYVITDKGQQVLEVLDQYVQTKKALNQLTASLSEIFPKAKRSNNRDSKT